MIKKFTGRGEPDPAAIATHEAAFHQFAKVVDRHLATHTWLANDALSIADYSLAATLLHAERAQYPMASYGNLTRMSAGSATPAVARDRASSVVTARRGAA